MKTTSRSIVNWRFLWAIPFLTLWLGSSTVRSQSLDPGRWDRLLKANVTEDGWVDYEAIRRKSSADLKAIIHELQRIDVDRLGTANERKAFWINAYNAITTQKLIDSDLPDEVPHASFFGKNIFKERTYRVAGKIRSLDDIEHGILRKKFRDSRIHPALVCGASSCPRLRPEAYTGVELDRQLDEEARRWVQVGRNKKGERKNYLDREKGIYYVSKIFDWYEEDFDDSTEGVLKFLRRYALDSDRKYLERNPVKVRYLTYDWNINSKPE